MLLASFALYLAVQFFPNTVRLPAPWDRSLYFNPFAWQFLFLLGLSLSQWHNTTIGKRLMPLTPWMFWLAVDGLVGGGVAKVVYTFCADPQFFFTLWRVLFEWTAEALPTLAAHFPGSEKSNLQFVRFVNFAFLVAAAVAVVPRQTQFWATSFARAIIRCGEQSLFVFCVHIINVNLANLCLAQRPDELGTQVLANAFGWLLMVAAASLAFMITTMSKQGRKESPRL